MDPTRPGPAPAHPLGSRLSRGTSPRFAGFGAVFLAVAIAGCAGSAPSGAPPSQSPVIPSAVPSAATTPSPGPSAPAATASPALTPTLEASSSVAPPPTSPPYVVTLYLRSWTIYPSIGPVNNFRLVPLVISGGQLMTVAYPPTSDPYPLYTGPTSRSVSQAGLARIVAEAQADGLLGSKTEFECPIDPGRIIAGGPGPHHIVMIVNGVTHAFSGYCPQPPEPTPAAVVPGTWEAFDRFARLLADPAAWLGSALGKAVAHDPASVAVLALPPEYTMETPNPDGAVAWPLASTFASLGAEFSYGDLRCAVISGADEAVLLPDLKTASVETWFRDSTGAYAKLVVRAVMPGETQPCAVG